MRKLGLKSIGKIIQKVTYREGKEPVANVICSGNPQVIEVLTVDYKNDSVLYMLKVYEETPSIRSLNSRSYPGKSTNKVSFISKDSRWSG